MELKPANEIRFFREIKVPNMHYNIIAGYYIFCEANYSSLQATERYWV